MEALRNYDLVKDGLYRAAKTVCTEHGTSLRRTVIEKMPNRSYQSVYGSLRNGNPSLAYLCEMCDALGVPIHEMLKRAADIIRGDIDRNGQQAKASEA
jgi:hypothetical protein